MPISSQHFDLPALKYRGRASVAALAISLITIGFLVLPNQRAFAQDPAMEQKLEQIKQASAANKQELAHFTWQEQQVISLKGDVKKTVIYQVSIGPDGTQQKTQLSSLPAPAPPSGRRLKQHIVEKKTDEFEEYGLNRQLGYTSPTDIIERYPQFYYNSVAPRIQTAIRYLNITSGGRQWIANLYSNLFRAEQNLSLSGPQQ